MISVARLHPEFYGLAADEDLTLRRTTAEVLHELGHLVGLVHCRTFSCLMRFAPDVESIDLRGVRLCPTCTDAAPGGWFAREI